MKELLKKYENKDPEIVFHWKDQETEAEGWTVINSLRGGAAGGGTRMRKGLDMNEVLSLAKRVYSIKLGKTAFEGSSDILKDNKKKLKELFL